MSRIGKLPIAVPDGVKVFLEGGSVRVEGPKGKLKTEIPPSIQVKMEGTHVRVSRETEERQIKALHGLTRKLIANMVEGVNRGFSRILEINGVGYRAEAVWKLTPLDPRLPALEVPQQDAPAGAHFAAM